MTVIVACSQNQAWCEFAQMQFAAIGIPAPAPTTRTGFSAAQLVSKMHAAASTGDKSAIASPGRAWEIAASDLFVENSDADRWGFADPLNLDLLEFWHNFDPNTRFVLIYGSPSDAIVASYDRNEWSVENIEAALIQWSEFHDRLLSHYYKYQERTLLVHLDQIAGTGDQLVAKLNTKFGMNATQSKKMEQLPYSQLDKIIAENIVETSAHTSALYDELNLSADLPRTRSNLPATDQIDSAISELSQLYQAAMENEPLRTKCDALASELVESRAVLRNAQARGESLEAVIAGKKDEILKLQLVSKELSDEREQKRLLEKRLDQSRSELTHYFEKYQYLARAFEDKRTEQHSAQSETATHVTTTKADTLTIDMSSYVDGQGWHGPEPAGRWAGAEQRATLSIPYLGAASRNISVRVVNAASKAHLEQVQLSFNGRVIPHRMKILTHLNGPLAPIRRLKALLQDAEHPYPAQLSARIDADLFSDQGLTNTLTIRTLAPLRPSDTDNADSRSLTICVSRVNIT